MWWRRDIQTDAPGRADVLGVSVVVVQFTLYTSCEAGFEYEGHVKRSRSCHILDEGQASKTSFSSLLLVAGNLLPFSNLPDLYKLSTVCWFSLVLEVQVWLWMPFWSARVGMHSSTQVPQKGNFNEAFEWVGLRSVRERLCLHRFVCFWDETRHHVTIWFFLHWSLSSCLCVCLSVCLSVCLFVRLCDNPCKPQISTNNILEAPRSTRSFLLHTHVRLMMREIFARWRLQLLMTSWTCQWLSCPSSHGGEGVFMWPSSSLCTSWGTKKETAEF